jgi:hypothetical protein
MMRKYTADSIDNEIVSVKLTEETWNIFNTKINVGLCNGRLYRSIAFSRTKLRVGVESYILLIWSMKLWQLQT